MREDVRKALVASLEDFAEECRFEAGRRRGWWRGLLEGLGLAVGVGPGLEHRVMRLHAAAWDASMGLGTLGGMVSDMLSFRGSMGSPKLMMALSRRADSLAQYLSAGLSAHSKLADLMRKASAEICVEETDTAELISLSRVLESSSGSGMDEVAAAVVWIAAENQGGNI
jgi:hypothetical protein